MTKLSRVASALSFAHLAGIGSFKGKRARADDDQDDRRPDDEADDESLDEREQDRDNGDSRKSKKGRRADDDRDDEEADDDQLDDGEDDDNKGKGAKRARADDDDESAEDDERDDDEDELRGKSSAASARRRERARCAAIMGSKYAAGNPVLAANLAFNTSMTRKQAVAVLRDTPAASSPGQGRSARNPALGAGGERSGNSRAAAASSWDTSMQRARPGK
ncbi:hypothetical protein [Chromobacterium rhizoryzae]|uniref:hypothetical protein n=1 Tax=Chromobacterium rhizoryzae TaxID=1778675 RepID=UPI001D079297|nr:hypothetical protein [Chromobacterium rhizoryzae]